MEIIKQIDFSRIYYLDAFDRDLSKLYNRDKDSLHKYQNWLSKKLLLMDGSDIEDLIQLKGFEKIQGIKQDFFSIRNLSLPGNPRVLFFIDDRNKKRSVYLLSVAFLEKNKSDYDKAIDVALDRWKHVSDSMSKIED